MTVYARCVEVIANDFSAKWYKEGKDYTINYDTEVEFGIFDEDGDELWCSWKNDLDCIWERVEY